MNESVIVFGAGIAGLSAAHYLVDRGYKVTVVESLSIPGGLARSERRAEDGTVPSEYSWRGFGPWYHNTFALMKDISLNDKVSSNGLIPSSGKTVYSQELSRPIDFIFTPNSPTPMTEMATFTKSLRLSSWDKIKLMYMTLKSWTASNERSEQVYAHIRASDWLNENLSPIGAKTLESIFGPWVGVDASRASVHHTARFFKKNIFPGKPAPYLHESIPEDLSTRQQARPSFIHGDQDLRWLILRRPSNEAWFDPWVKQLKSKGVNFLFDTKLTSLIYNNKTHTIDGATVSTEPGTTPPMKADYYVMAINPFDTQNMLALQPQLQRSDSQLQLFESLVSDKDAVHTQISFQIAFSEKVKLPGVETAIILVDSPYDITFFSQDQLFHPTVDLGYDEKGNPIKSLWSGTATIDNENGVLYGKPFTQLTRQEFENEIIQQIYDSKALDEMVQAENEGRHLQSFPMAHFQVWYTWQFPMTNDEEKVHDVQHKKWVNNTHNITYQPTTKTSLSNFFLAGAHTKTNADLYSMEAAVESGKRAADMISSQDTVIPQQESRVGKVFKSVDSVLYRMNLPHVLNVLMILLLTVGVIIFIRYFFLLQNK